MSIFDVFRRKKSIPSPWNKYYTENDLNINIPNISMYDQILKASKKYPNNIAIQYFSTKMKYKKFINEIDRAAISFKEFGIYKGDIVTILMPNTPEALIAVYALNKLGVIASMVHPLSSSEEIKDSLNSTNSKYLVATDMFYSKIKDIIGETNVKKVIFTSISSYMTKALKIGYYFTKGRKYKKYPKNNFFISWNKFLNLSKNKSLDIKSKYGKNTPAVILHSGGTSGKPKNVVLQNRAFILITKQEKKVLKDMVVGDKCLAIMPNFHGFGLAVSMHTQISLGFTSILVPQFDAKKFDTLLRKTKPSIVLGVPTLYEALASSNNEPDLDLSCLKYVICGGDILSNNLEDRVNDYLLKHSSKVKITQGYGMSEALAAVSLSSDNHIKSGSIGIPLPGNHIKIIDPSTRNTLPFGEIGEICINSKALMMGYLNNESETNEALQIHKDGHIWLHTGDLGYMDEDGFIFYKGRQKRMIITSGYNVYPSHIEEVIEKHEAVLQCTVVGMPHPYKHEVAKAFIVLKEGYKGLFIKSQIKEYCKKNLSKYMVPYKFVYRKSLPKTKLGKVDFKKLQSDIVKDDD